MRFLHTFLAWMRRPKPPAEVITGPMVVWGKKKQWPVCWPIKLDDDAWIEHLQSMVRQQRQMAARTEFINDQSYRLVCREARLQRFVSDRACTALRRIMVLADERKDHELHVMAAQGMTCAQDREMVWREYEHDYRAEATHTQQPKEPEDEQTQKRA